jgi:hypothetical protein
MRGLNSAAVAATGAVLAPAGVLLWAGLAKAAVTGRLRETVRGLPLRHLSSRPAVVHALPPLLIAGELLAATGLLLFPTTAWPRALVLALALAFAAVGVLAASAGAKIHCNCFGGDHDTTLGLRQLWQLPLWTTAMVVAQGRPPQWSWLTGLALFCCLLVGFTAVRLAGLLRLWLPLRATRKAVLVP